MVRTIDLKRAVLALAMLALVASAGFLGTRAFFSDTETSQGNVFAAGSLDLEIGIEGAGSDDNFAPKSIPGNQSLFIFEDMIPGDTGTGYFRLESSQDAWACLAADVTGEDENNRLAQEENAGDSTPNIGELQDYMEIAIWEANGTANADGLVGPNETETLRVMTLEEFANGNYYAIQDSASGDNPLLAGQEVDHEFAYCFGKFERNNNGTPKVENNMLSCDGGAFGTDTNQAQTDRVEATLHFYAEQMQNNDDFVCSSISGANPPGSGVVAGMSLTSSYDAPTSCTVTVDDTNTNADYTGTDGIQTAIDDASSGDTICVDAGTYEPFTVDKDVTVVGLNNPTGSDAAVITGASTDTRLVLVNASGATVKGLKISGGSYDTQFAGIGIIEYNADISNITIDSNVVSNLDVTGSGSSNKAIQVYADPNGGNTISDVMITNNRINNITSTKGAYGVQIVNNVDGVTVTNNTISNFTGGWGAGVAVDGNNPVTTSDVTIARNQITQHSGSHFSVQVEVNAKSDEVAVNYNNLKNLLHGGSSGNPAGEALDAENNWWGDTNPANDVFNAPASNQTDYEPFAMSAYPTN